MGHDRNEVYIATRGRCAFCSKVAGAAQSSGRKCDKMADNKAIPKPIWACSVCKVHLCDECRGPYHEWWVVRGWRSVVHRRCDVCEMSKFDGVVCKHSNHGTTLLENVHSGVHPWLPWQRRSDCQGLPSSSVAARQRRSTALLYCENGRAPVPTKCGHKSRTGSRRLYLDLILT